MIVRQKVYPPTPYLVSSTNHLVPDSVQAKDHPRTKSTLASVSAILIWIRTVCKFSSCFSSASRDGCSILYLLKQRIALAEEREAQLVIKWKTKNKHSKMARSLTRFFCLDLWNSIALFLILQSKHRHTGRPCSVSEKPPWLLDSIQGKLSACARQSPWKRGKELPGALPVSPLFWCRQDPTYMNLDKIQPTILYAGSLETPQYFYNL